MITAFNTTAGALAQEQDNVRATIRELGPTFEAARPSLANLNEALPPLRAYVLALEPGVAELPDLIDAATPWLDAADELLADDALGGLARGASPGRACHRRARPRPRSRLMDELSDLSRCVTDNARSDLRHGDHGRSERAGGELAAGLPRLPRLGGQHRGRGGQLRRQRLVPAGPDGRRRRAHADDQPDVRHRGNTHPLRQHDRAGRTAPSRRSRPDRRRRRSSRTSRATESDPADLNGPLPRSARHCRR